ncbi:histidine kinase [Dactylosporangium sp. AC04546]|uniref:sensor histidine kinase n=1 Tax=Dactylosporangium sp. AC04546 TaxID=2862460 RepID=UPI001EDF9B74|nr:histidine kinase [Dactylosporangium sp. AC04546]WVK89247.1 histidine kinase [Dactylosporangium sp. AC04546]
MQTTPARPVLWVPFVLYGAVLVAGLVSRPGAAGWPGTAGFVAGIAALVVLEILERRRHPVRTPPRVAAVLLVVRVALFTAVAALDQAGLATALFVLVPFTAYFAFGGRVAAGLGLTGLLAMLVYYGTSVPGWYTDEERVTDLLMYGVGLTLALAMAAVAVTELDTRTRLERALQDVAELSAADERNRVARDIHDSLGHHLTAIAVQLEKASAFRDRDPDASARAVADAHWSAKQALDEVRQSVRALREAPFSLSSALRDLAWHAEDDRMRVTVEISGHEQEHAVAARIALYRAAQEAITNARKHGRAGSVAIAATFGERDARLVVADDGVGLPSAAAARPAVDATALAVDAVAVAGNAPAVTGNAAARNAAAAVGSGGGGFGLAGMQERVRLLSGTVDVRPGPPGVTVTVTIPREGA